MKTRRDFLKHTGIVAAGSILMPSIGKAALTGAVTNAGLQLYTFRNEMLNDAKNTLKLIAELGIKQVESAGSDKGYYYGLKPAEMKSMCNDLGMTLRSGHVQLDAKWPKTISDAVAAGQEYLICSSMPVTGQTIDNYKKTADAFNKAGQECKAAGLKFGYHNHDFEFETVGDKVLYDVLLENTDADMVHMELDLGWVVASGKDPLYYFKRFQNRFPLWHLKDMNVRKKKSVEFGKGALNIQQLMDNAKQSGMKYYFIEQEEYRFSPKQSVKDNMAYLRKLKM